MARAEQAIRKPTVLRAHQIASRRSTWTLVYTSRSRCRWQRRERRTHCHENDDRAGDCRFDGHVRQSVCASERSRGSEDEQTGGAASSARLVDTRSRPLQHRPAVLGHRVQLDRPVGSGRPLPGGERGIVDSGRPAPWLLGTARLGPAGPTPNQVQLCPLQSAERTCQRRLRQAGRDRSRPRQNPTTCLPSRSMLVRESFHLSNRSSAHLLYRARRAEKVAEKGVRHCQTPFSPCRPTGCAGSTQRVFEQCNRNVSETARRLNMHRRTLQRILNKRAPRE